MSCVEGHFDHTWSDRSLNIHLPAFKSNFELDDVDTSIEVHALHSMSVL